MKHLNQSIHYLEILPTLKSAWLKLKGTKSSIFTGCFIIFLLMGVITITSIALYFVVVHILLQYSFTNQKILHFMVNSLLLLFYPFQAGVNYIGLRRALNLSFSYRNIFAVMHFAVYWKVAFLYLIKYFILLGNSMFFFGIEYLLSTYHVISNDNIWNNIFNIIIFISSIYIMMRILLALAFILDKKLNPLQAILASIQATRHNMLGILTLFMIQIVIVIASIIPFGLGLIWTFPLSYILYGEIYKNITYSSGH